MISHTQPKVFIIFTLKTKGRPHSPQVDVIVKPCSQFQYFISPHLHITINASTHDTYRGNSPFVITQVNDCIKLNNERLKGNYAEFGVEVKQRITSAEIDCEHNSFTYEQFASE